ncbi:MAG: GAF domain-containing protein, partial [Anaerolineales bacterium]|nr:GAF domain-containing protein [Anaerolineales bacterium]
MSDKHSNSLLRLVAIFSLLVLAYLIIGTWFTWPANMPMGVAWHGTDLTIYNVFDPDRFEMVPQPGDIIVAIDGQAPKRNKAAFSPPIKENYTFSIRREALEEPFDIVITDLSFQPRLFAPAPLVSLLTWALGIMLLFNRSQPGQRRQAVAAGLVFSFSSLVLAGINASNYGIPGASLFPPLLGFNAAILPFLGLIPRDKQFSVRNRRWYWGLLSLAAVYFLVSFYEQWILFPFGRSTRQVTGGLYDLGTIGYTAIAFGLVGAVGLLLFRAWRSRSSFERKRLRILLLFVAMGVGPLLFLTVLPGLLFRIRILPLMFGVGFLSFIPLGYFFVFSYPGYLQMDLRFSRIISLILLALVPYTIFASIAALSLGNSFVADNGLLAGLLLSLFALTVLLQPIITGHINQIIFGHNRLTDGQISEFATLLTHQPTPKTLQRVMSAAMDTLNVSTGILLQQSPVGLIPIVAINVPPENLLYEAEQKRRDPSFVSAGKMSVRSKSFAWAEMEMPLTFADRETGLLALSSSLPNHHFDSRQRASLLRFADMLAIALEAIHRLEERSQEQAAAYLLDGELDRRRLSSAIHDEPLQTLNVALSTIERHFQQTGVSELQQATD